MEDAPQPDQHPPANVTLLSQSGAVRTIKAHRRPIAMTRTLLALLSVLLLSAPCARAQQTTLLRPASVLDVRTGRLLDGARVLVRDGRIAAVGRDVAAPAGAEVIDLPGHVLLPGLIDAHTHLLIQPDYASNNPILYKSIPYRTLEGVAAAKATLEAGFTTVRDVDSEGADWADVALRDAIEDGLVPGPRMQVATRALSITGGYMNQNGLAPQIDVPQYGALVDNADDIVKEIRTEVKYGTDLIKLYATGTTRHIDLKDMTPLPQFTTEEIGLVMREAARFKIPVAAHAYGGQGAYDAVVLGARSIEHGMLLEDRVLDEMVARGTWWVPTISVYFEPGPRDSWSARARAIADAHRATFGRALAKGVRIAFGTDAGAIPHGSQATEFQVMVEYGMRPLQAVQSATLEAAELMGYGESLGAVEAGRIADLIAVPRNPLEDITVLQDVRFVMKDGVVHRRP